MRERTYPDGTRVPGGLPAWLVVLHAEQGRYRAAYPGGYSYRYAQSALLAKSFKALGGYFGSDDRLCAHVHASAWWMRAW